ncbi:MAG: FixH family protein [Raineya sp.]
MNWGTKIAISLGAFITFILVLGFVMMYANKEGVEKDYYEKDLLYEQEIQAQRNAQVLSERVQFQIQAENLMIDFPKEIKNYEGVIVFQRPDDSKKDKTEKMQIAENSRQIINISGLQKGLWKVQAIWEMNGKKYQSEKYDFVLMR